MYLPYFLHQKITIVLLSLPASGPGQGSNVRSGPQSTSRRLALGHRGVLTKSRSRPFFKFINGRTVELFTAFAPGRPQTSPAQAGFVCDSGHPPACHSHDRAFVSVLTRSTWAIVL
ncbi:hypothetical protein LZ30DRAFT_453522 [Colletotrichum cereale]|nr:hypothetical protein LZ30DRAFT_453522 [Colletotrichum cereale]